MATQGEHVKLAVLFGSWLRSCGRVTESGRVAQPLRPHRILGGDHLGHSRWHSGLVWLRSGTWGFLGQGAHGDGLADELVGHTELFLSDALIGRKFLRGRCFEILEVRYIG